MKICILIDNLGPAGTSPIKARHASQLKAEHGFAAYIVTDGGKRILCDTGASDAFISNAEAMGIELHATDFAIISHGHTDHTGGLEAFAKRYPVVPIFLAKEICGQRYFSDRIRSATPQIPTTSSSDSANGKDATADSKGDASADGKDATADSKGDASADGKDATADSKGDASANGKDATASTNENGEPAPMRDISTAPSAIEAIEKPYFVDGSMFVTAEVAIVAPADHGYSKPRGNSHLYASQREGKQESSEQRENLKECTTSSESAALRKDDFAHERALAIKTAEGLVIVSPCSHMGAMNIIKSCVEFTGEKKVLAFIGGLHLVDSPTAIRQQHNNTETTTAIHQQYNNTKTTATGHQHLSLTTPADSTTPADPTTPADSETHKLIKEITSEYPDIQIYTGHCTGQDAKKILTSENIGKVRTIIFNTGSIISLD